MRKYLIVLGTISYEVFLLHGQMEQLIGDTWLSAILVFIGTVILAVLLHTILKIKINNIAKSFEITRAKKNENSTNNLL